MLFLAVFCGFLAEYKLEHTIEHQREKKYINTLAKDVELDIASLHETSVIKRKYVNYFDSLVYLLKQNNNSSLKDIYFYARHLGRITEFKYHDRTIQQLKNSGSLRLIRNKDAADSITIYDSQDIKLILNQQEIERQMRSDILSNQIGKIFNGYIWNDMVDSKGVISRTSGNPELATNNQELINDFVVHVAHLKTAYRLTEGNIGAAIIKANNFIYFLKKEYHLK